MNRTNQLYQKGVTPHAPSEVSPPGYGKGVHIDGHIWGVPLPPPPPDEHDALDTFEAKAMEHYAEALELLVQKHRDYGPLNISASPGGALNGLRVRMFDKLARINNLIESGDRPANEPLEDSFKDLANYSMIALMVMKGDWPK